MSDSTKRYLVRIPEIHYSCRSVEAPEDATPEEIKALAEAAIDEIALEFETAVPKAFWHVEDYDVGGHEEEEKELA